MSAMDERVVRERAETLYEAARIAAQHRADNDLVRQAALVRRGRQNPATARMQGFDEIPGQVRRGWMDKARRELAQETTSLSTGDPE